VFVPWLFLTFDILRFFLRIFMVTGAEGGLRSDILFLPFLLGTLIFLENPNVLSSALSAP